MRSPRGLLPLFRNLDYLNGLFFHRDYLAPETNFGQLLEIILSKYPKFTNFLHIVDDIAVYGESKEELEEQFSLFLDICRENHLTLSPKEIPNMRSRRFYQVCYHDTVLKRIISRS